MRISDCSSDVCSSDLTLINATQKVIVGNVGFEIECVKQPSLTTRSLTHHRRVLPQNRIDVDQTSTPRASSEISRSFSTELAGCRRLQAMTMIVGPRAHVAGWPVQ